MKLNPIKLEDLDESIHKHLKIQDYSTRKTIAGIQLIDLKKITQEDGYFLELARLSEKGGIFNIPNFEIKQINYSVIEKGGIKAWHLHLNQDDIWFVPPENRLLVGLHDLREKSSTKGTTMRIVLGNHKATFLYIPRGVAHGCTNISPHPTTVIYFVNSHFETTNSDEYRLAWDFLGKDFWQMTKG